MELIEVKEVLNDGVKRSSPFKEPVPSEALVYPFIVVAMERHIIPLLGREFYNHLVSEKGGAVSVYNPSERREEVVVVAFEEEEYESLWIGGLRDLCGWAVSLECLITMGTQLRQGGITKMGSDGKDKGVDNETENRLILNWGQSVEVFKKRVIDYLSKKIEVVGFELYKNYVISKEYKEEVDNDYMLGDIGFLKTSIPKW